jgi:hypothetical protein
LAKCAIGTEFISARTMDLVLDLLEFIFIYQCSRDYQSNKCALTVSVPVLNVLILINFLADSQLSKNFIQCCKHDETDTRGCEDAGVGGGWDVEARHPQHARYVVYLSAWHGHCGSSCTMLPRLVQHVSDGAVEAGEEADLLNLHIKEAHFFYWDTNTLFHFTLFSPSRFTTVRVPSMQ